MLASDPEGFRRDHAGLQPRSRRPGHIVMYAWCFWFVFGQRVEGQGTIASIGSARLPCIGCSRNPSPLRGARMKHNQQRGCRSGGVVPELLASHELAAEAMHGRQRAEKRQIRNVTKKANVKL